MVFEGLSRNPVTIFNEKAVLRLGRGLQQTGRLNEEGVQQALMVMNRYHAVARAMGANPFEVLATAAVRDASNGPEFVAGLQSIMPGVPIRILSGKEEASYSAAGVLCGIPTAEGILLDIGGGSLEAVKLVGGRAVESETMRLGVIRLADRAAGDLTRARIIVEEDTARVPWLGDGAGQDLYLVGGAFRALARIHMTQTSYPLNMLHHYTIARDEARDLAGVVAGASRRALERLPGLPRRRIDDLPFAAVVLRRLLRVTGASRVVFSANGLREGWLMHILPPDVRAAEPITAAARDMATLFSRDPRLAPALIAWTAPLMVGESPEQRLLREAACWFSDIASHDHPEYRAEQGFLRVLRQPGIAIDHHARAYLALAIAMRYEAEPDAPFLAPARMLLDMTSVQQAEVLGAALQLAYTLSGGTPDLLASTELIIDSGKLILNLREDAGVFAGESIIRKLGRLAAVLGLDPYSGTERVHSDAA
ncbi:Ppx/GppA phosphatase family protein [Acidisoma silvae]|uniref:Ppx/GppA phosphatase family protein n=1 Tax=Acidisoma silvae TaxID=2802396 RepID=UPI001D0A5752|nr:Ppx/GppA family phosphatase [Acidisoma silvae]